MPTPNSNFGFNPSTMMKAGAGGVIDAGLDSLFSNWENPSDAADPYFQQMPDQLKQYFNPYIDAGNRALPGLEKQYGQLTNDPGGRLNEIGAGYHQSPGFQFAMQQALQGAGHAAAAGGMAGSPQHEQQNMGIATNLANQDYNGWLQNALGLYGTGLQGQQGMYNTGAESGMRLGENLSSILAQRAKLAYEGQNTENQRDEGIWGSIGGGVGTLASLAFL